jgi:phosphomannomutase
VGLVLEHMALTGERASQLAAALPRLSMLKHDLAVEPNRIHSLLQRLYEELEREGVDYDQTDGVKVTRPDGWVHVRVSNTESLIRVIAEADAPDAAHDLLDWARDRLGR